MSARGSLTDSALERQLPAARLLRARRAGDGMALDLALLLAGWVWLGLVAGGAPVPLRAVATFAFVAFVPGLALRAWIPAADRLERFVFTLGASLSVCVLITLVLALAHVFTAELAIICLAGVTSLAAAADLAGLGRPAGAG